MLASTGPITDCYASTPEMRRRLGSRRLVAQVFGPGRRHHCRAAATGCAHLAAEVATHSGQIHGALFEDVRHSERPRAMVARL
jgi:hypothetical protein